MVSAVVHAQLLEEVRKRGLVESGPLWPAEYAQRNARSAWRFVRECRTWNEAEREVQWFPNRTYMRRIVREWCRCWRAGVPLVIEKSRRLVTSWLLRALELWAMGVKRSNNIITHTTHEDAAGHVWRIFHLYDDLRKRHPEWRLKPAKPYGALAAEKLDMVVLPNGSRVEEHFEQPTGLQGSGYSIVTMEELSVYRRPAAMYDQALKVVQASAGAVNGFVVVVTNASASEDYKLVKAGAPGTPYGLRPHGRKPENGMFVCQLDNGAVFMRIHYSADPDKTDAWAAAEKRKEADPRTWEVQMEMGEVFLEGRPVFPTYSDALHAPSYFSRHQIPFVATAKHIAGWDCGNSIHPAFVLIQVTPRGPRRQVHLLGEVIGAPGTAMTDFAPQVIAWLGEYYPELPVGWILHGADESGKARQGATGKSAFQVAAEFGIDLQPITNQWAKRRDAVAKLLNQMVDEKVPFFWICEKLAPIIAAGFRGGYRLKQLTEGINAVYGEPVKDLHSHPQDALQYAAILAWLLLESEGDTEQVQRFKASERKELPGGVVVTGDDDDETEAGPVRRRRVGRARAT